MVSPFLVPDIHGLLQHEDLEMKREFHFNVSFDGRHIFRTDWYDDVEQARQIRACLLEKFRDKFGMKVAVFIRESYTRCCWDASQDGCLDVKKKKFLIPFKGVFSESDMRKHNANSPDILEWLDTAGVGDAISIGESCIRMPDSTYEIEFRLVDLP